MSGLHDDQIPREIDPECGLPIGPALLRSGPAKNPQRIVLNGRYCRLEPLDPKSHGDDLYSASMPPDSTARFRYLPECAPTSMHEFSEWMVAAAKSKDPLFFAVIDKRSGRVEGRQSLMRITPLHQCIEIGHIYWGPSISQSRVATEANFLFSRYVFEDLGYRRYEWKCDALNVPSRRAALRFGFRYEGHFRRATIVRGRSRDTAWFSIIDEEWPLLKSAYEKWLAPENFDADGKQKH